MIQSVGPTIVLLCSAVFLLSFSGTFAVKRYTEKNLIIDVPNERSSHNTPTPRGGGLAFVLVFLITIFCLMITHMLNNNLTIALIGGGLLVAICGWIDDKKGISIKSRIICHFIAGFWALYWVGGFPSLCFNSTGLYLGGWGSVIALFIIVWMINLYNFMDGIDGFASSEAIIVSITTAILFLRRSQELTLVCLVLGVSVAGFLVWNWPPAKIFMGDVGSGFLGFVIAVVMIFSENTGALSVFAWIILLSVFIIDATLTLLKRIIRKEKWYEAHRSHVYQLATQVGYTHRQVTFAVIIINIILALISAHLFYSREWSIAIVSIIIFVLSLLQIILQHKFCSMIVNHQVINEVVHQEVISKQVAASDDEIVR